VFFPFSVYFAVFFQSLMVLSGWFSPIIFSRYYLPLNDKNRLQWNMRVTSQFFCTVICILAIASIQDERLYSNAIYGSTPFGGFVSVFGTSKF
jgi:hypothetical protein